jgi:hypothetical protein
MENRNNQHVCAMIIYLFEQSGDTVETKTFEGFMPRVW